MKPINERINYFLKENKIKKIDFAKKLNISSAAVTQICNGDTSPSNQTIALICEAYGINREWLVDGIGEMLAPMSKAAAIGMIANRLIKSDDPFKLKLISLLSEMDEAQMMMIKEFAEKLLTEDNIEQ